ncbi:ParA family protein [Marinimicrobium alkaliphilum]|uniref:ParA family protein n=1 Tax=Marinimicrobium alkaliphilum TaxID=2202654 RepID=UPI000DBA5439|nr:ParA family protein [Marinimicrobium alkaliphilum]
MQVWAIANQKGGVGKTTSTVSLAGLAAERGQRVLMLDLDPHGSLSSYFRQDPDAVEQSVYTLFEERASLTPARIRSLIRPTGFDNLDLLPSSSALATLERRAVGQDGMGLVVARALAQIYDDYDQVVIDTPPLLGVLMINALAASRQLIIPVQTEFLAIKGLERMVATLQMMSKSRKQGIAYTIVPVMYDRRTQASVSSLLAIRNAHPDNVWPGKVPVDTRFRDASKAGVPPHLYEPGSRGVEAYRSLYKWLQQPAKATSQAAGGIR